MIPKPSEEANELDLGEVWARAPFGSALSMVTSRAYHAEAHVKELDAECDGWMDSYFAADAEAKAQRERVDRLEGMLERLRVAYDRRGTMSCCSHKHGCWPSGVHPQPMGAWCVACVVDKMLADFREPK